MASVLKPWRKEDIRDDKRNTLYDGNTDMFLGCSLGRTSGGVFAGGVPSEVLDEALDGEGLTDSFEFLSASVAPLPFIWEHNRSSLNTAVNAEYQDPPQGGSLGSDLTFPVCV